MYVCIGGLLQKGIGRAEREGGSLMHGSGLLLRRVAVDRRTSIYEIIIYIILMCPYVRAVTAWNESRARMDGRESRLPGGPGDRSRGRGRSEQQPNQLQSKATGSRACEMEEREKEEATRARDALGVACLHVGAHFQVQAKSYRNA